MYTRVHLLPNAFMSTVVKIAANAAFYRIFALCFTSVQGTYILVLENYNSAHVSDSKRNGRIPKHVKRILAYSSVATLDIFY